MSHSLDLLFEPREIVVFEHFEIGYRNVNIAPIHRRPAILEIAIGGALPRIEIDYCDLVTLVSQRDGNMHGGCRLSGPAFLIREYDMMRFAFQDLILPLFLALAIMVCPPHRPQC